MQQGITVGAAPSPPATTAGRRRLLATYLAVVTGDAWIVSVLIGARWDGDLLQNLALGTQWFITSGLALVLILAVGMIPGMVLSMAVAARRPPSSRGRALAGAIGWGAWSVVIFLGNAITSAQTPFAPSVYAGVSLLAVSGALVAVVGLRPDTRPAGQALTSLAVAIVVIVVLFSLYFAGRLVGPA